MDRYAPICRPSVDPVVFFQFALIMVFEGVRSERQLMRVVTNRFSLSCYLGYDLAEFSDELCDGEGSVSPEPRRR